MRNSVRSFSESFTTCELYYPETLQPPFGWITMFLRDINATWPHPDHLLVNLAVPGAPLHRIAQEECFDAMLSSTVDLVIMEHLPYLEPQKPGDMTTSIELILHRLHHSLGADHPQPPVILFTMHRIFDDLDVDAGGKERYDKIDSCVRQGCQRLFYSHEGDPLCSGVCASDSLEGLPLAGEEDGSAEVETNQFAGLNDMPSFSYTKLLRQLIERQQASQGGGGTSCRVFASLYQDLIHPSPLGELLFADLLSDYLGGSLRHFLCLLSSLTISLTAVRSKEYVLAHPVKADTKQKPRIHPSSKVVPVLRCYVTRGGKHIVAGQQLPPKEINVTRAVGFSVVQRENGKYKPGWVASETGSSLTVSISMDLELHGGTLRSDASIHITFLRSYAHMGQASVSCLSGCECGTLTFEGYHKEHWSSPTIASLDVWGFSPHRDCEIQVGRGWELGGYLEKHEVM